MKRLAYILLGLAVGGTCAYAITYLIGFLIEPYYTPTGEDEMTRNFMIFFVAFLVISIVGGIIANIIYNKNLTGKKN